MNWTMSEQRRDAERHPQRAPESGQQSDPHRLEAGVEEGDGEAKAAGESEAGASAAGDASWEALVASSSAIFSRCTSQACRRRRCRSNSSWNSFAPMSLRSAWHFAVASFEVSVDWPCPRRTAWPHRWSRPRSSSAEAARKQRRRDDKPDQLVAHAVAARCGGAEEVDQRRHQQGEAERLQDALEGDRGAVFVHRAQQFRFAFAADAADHEDPGDDRMTAANVTQPGRRRPARLPPQDLSACVRPPGQPPSGK